MSANHEAVSVLVWVRATTKAAEWAWGQEVCRRMLAAELGAEQTISLHVDREPTVADALSATTTAKVGIVVDDVSFWGEDAWARLCRALDADSSLTIVAPCSNEAAGVPQRCGPPFLYQTPSLLRLAAADLGRRRAGQTARVSELDPFAFLVRRRDLELLDGATPLTAVPSLLARRGNALAVALDVYVHRYARIHDQPRPDLQEWIPADARSLLDLGCATGELGVAVKARQECRVVGIELNPILADAAERRIDRVLRENVESMDRSTFSAEFDVIVCGDVLEHLVDPWAVVGKLAAWLCPGGRLIATLPNVGHWSLVADLIAGRWDLIPFGLLCFGHLRFFTRSGIEQLFGRDGLTIERIVAQKEPPSPPGEDFLTRASTAFPEADRESLETSEFLVVARRG